GRIRYRFGCAERSRQEEKGSGGCNRARGVGATMAHTLGAPPLGSLREQGRPEFQLHQRLLCHEGWRLKSEGGRVQASKGRREKESLGYYAKENERAPAFHGPLHGL